MKLVELTDEQYRDLKPGFDVLGCRVAEGSIPNIFCEEDDLFGVDDLGWELNERQWQFEEYMTRNRWDTCCSEGIYEDDGIRAVSMFVEFCLEGKVTDDDGKELEA